MWKPSRNQLSWRNKVCGRQQCLNDMKTVIKVSYVLETKKSAYRAIYVPNPSPNSYVIKTVFSRFLIVFISALLLISWGFPHIAMYMTALQMWHLELCSAILRGDILFQTVLASKLCFVQIINSLYFCMRAEILRVHILPCKQISWFPKFSWLLSQFSRHCFLE